MYEVDGQTYRLLRVPYHPQGEDPLGSGNSDNFCLPMSLKMVLDFMVDPYQKPKYKDHNRSWKFREIQDLLPTMPNLACKVFPGFLDPLSQELKCFELRDVAMTSLDAVEVELADEKPVILMFNPRTLTTGRPGGMLHAAVAVGMTKEFVFVNDPYRASPVRHARARFEMAWSYEPINAIVLRS